MVFVGLLVLMIGGIVATAACFLVAKIFLPLRQALVLAPLLVASSGVGCIVGLLAQNPFMPEELSSGGQVLRYFGTGLAVGVLSAGTSLWLFLRWRARWKARTAASQMSAFD
jgi:hypothetical protein